MKAFFDCLYGFSGNYGESGMEAFKDMAAKEGICIAHSGKSSRCLSNSLQMQRLLSE